MIYSYYPYGGVKYRLAACYCCFLILDKKLPVSPSQKEIIIFSGRKPWMKKLTKTEVPTKMYLGEFMRRSSPPFCLRHHLKFVIVLQII